MRAAPPRRVAQPAPPRRPELLKGIYEMGFKRPTKVQEKALPMILANPCGPAVHGAAGAAGHARTDRGAQTAQPNWAVTVGDR